MSNVDIIPRFKKEPLLVCIKKNNTKKFSETDIIKLLDFLLKTYLSCFVNTSFKVTVGIPNGINYALLLVVLFFYSNEEYFMQWLLNINVKNRAQSFHFISRYRGGFRISS